MKPKGRSAPKAMPRRGSAPAGQETEVARLTRERDEALGQQAATADVLQIISSSPANLDTVLETILATLRADTPRARPHAQPFLVLIIVVVMMVIIAVMMMMVVMIVPMVMMMITPPAMVMMVVVVLSELRPAVRARIGSSCILALE